MSKAKIFTALSMTVFLLGCSDEESRTKYLFSSPEENRIQVTANVVGFEQGFSSHSESYTSGNAFDGITGSSVSRGADKKPRLYVTFTIKGKKFYRDITLPKAYAIEMIEKDNIPEKLDFTARLEFCIPKERSKEHYNPFYACFNLRMNDAPIRIITDQDAIGYSATLVEYVGDETGKQTLLRRKGRPKMYNGFLDRETSLNMIDRIHKGKN